MEPGTEVDDGTQGVEGALRALAEDEPDAGLVEDIIAARLFTRVRSPVKVGRFTVLEVVGSGGMGTVYSAHDSELDRTVALKLVRPSSTSDEPSEAARSRLLREARVLARLAHPNVVTIYEHGIHDDQVFLVMELVAGLPLAQWLVARPRRWTEVLEVYLGAGDGLAAAHAIGIVHRDFKPANVLVGTDGRPRVVDFGLARPIVHAASASSDGVEVHAAFIDESITASGLVSGTPGYIAPELLAGGKPSPQSDVYAFCVALLEALSPSSAQRGQALAARTRGIPSAIIDALLRGISPDPDERWPTMAPLLVTLRAAMGDTDPRGSPSRGGVRAWGMVAALAVAIATIVALVAMVLAR